MGSELVRANARIVTDDIVVAGALVVRDGRIAEVIEGGTVGTDELVGLAAAGPGRAAYRQSRAAVLPSPGVRWPADAAMLAHDAQVAAAGITTVCDAVCVGFYGGKSERLDYLSLSIEVLRRAQAARALKADHFLHLRLELTDPHMLELFEPLMREPSLRLVSFMDHTPGQRQWRDLDKFRSFSLGREVHTRPSSRRWSRAASQSARPWGAPSRRGAAAARGPRRGAREPRRRDAGACRRGTACGCTIAEFPTTLGAAEAARAAGMGIVMGAPNLVIGGSHSGNVSAAELVRSGLLDVFSSDYVPASLLQAAFLLHEGFGIPMPQAIAPVTRTPADLLGLADAAARARPAGRFGAGPCRRTTPTVVAVWREGRRIG